ncbi:hypothetical protein [Streptomyces xanthophaeus]|uniref:hypothetical protein n=1 Tax=Streptomyces xanthophaeus TaxID=67385 RepID=UPI00386615D5
MPAAAPTPPPAFATRATSTEGSPVREILALTERPGTISFAGGLPAPELFDAEGLRTAYDTALTTTPRRALLRRLGTAIRARRSGERSGRSGGWVRGAGASGGLCLLGGIREVLGDSLMPFSSTKPPEAPAPPPPLHNPRPTP